MWQQVTAFAAFIAPIGAILGAASALLGLVYGIFRLRKVVLRIIAFFIRLTELAQKAVAQSSEAAAKSDETVEGQRKVRDANADVHEVLVQLAAEHGRTLIRLEEALRVAQHAQHILDTRLLRMEEHYAAAEIRHRHRDHEGTPT